MSRNSPIGPPYYGLGLYASAAPKTNPPKSTVLRVWDEASSPQALNKLTREVAISTSTTSLGTLRLIDDGHLQLGHKNLFGQDYETPHLPIRRTPIDRPLRSRQESYSLLTNL